MIVIGRVVLFTPFDDGVLESQQHARIDLDREVQIDRSFAALLGVDVHLPGLAQRVALDEVALVVHMEAVLDRVILEIRHEAGNVDDRQVVTSPSLQRSVCRTAWSLSTRVRNAAPRCERACFSAAVISANVRPPAPSGTNTGS